MGNLCNACRVAMLTLADMLPSDHDLLETLLGGGIRMVAAVPCSVTDTWQRLAADAAAEGRLSLVMTTHEGNLAGIAAGYFFATGRPALVHMQNSGLPNCGDGFISFASDQVYGIPAVALVTWRGSGPGDDSEPHQAIGRRTHALCEAVFGSRHLYGDIDGRDVLGAARHAVAAAAAGNVGVLRLAPGSFRRSPEVWSRPAPLSRGPRAATHAAGCVDGFAAPVGRDAAIERIVAAHPQAAILFCNGYTARAAQAVADRPGNFYNVGYMGGTLAVGWALATYAPHLEVVVVDGDQNAAMSTMKDHAHCAMPANLRWYVLDNGVGESVGDVPSLPLSPLIRTMACVIETVPEPPGAFTHRRVRTVGAYGRWAATQPAGTLNGLARGFRAWVADQGES